MQVPQVRDRVYDRQPCSASEQYNLTHYQQKICVTPVMEAGLADHVWAIEEIIALIG